MTTKKKRGPGRPKGSRNKKSNGTASESKRKIEKIKEKRELNARLRDIIWGIIYIALGAMLFAAVGFHQAGTLGNTVGDFFKGMLGIIGLMLPWYLIVLGILLITKLSVHYSLKTFILSVCMLLLFTLLNSVRYIDQNNIVFSLRAFYENGVSLSGGGLFGMTIGSIIVRFLGKAGLLVISASGIAISLLLLLNTPVSSWLQRRKELREETILLHEAEEEGITTDEQDESSVSEDDMPGHPVSNAEPVINKADDAVNETKRKRGTSVIKNIIRSIIGFENDSDDEEITSPANAGTSETKDDIPFIPDDDAMREEPEIVTQDEPDQTSEQPENRESSLATFIKEVNPFENQKKRLDPDSTQEIPIDAIRKAGSESEINDNPEDYPKNINVDPNDTRNKKNEIDTSRKQKISYKRPSLDLLSKPSHVKNKDANNELRRKAAILDETLRNFGVDARVVQVTQGPAVTRYEVQPSVGVKVSKIVSLADDIALNLEAKSIRMEAPIPGKAAVGIEVENTDINTVTLREILATKKFKDEQSKISFAVGKDIGGNPIVGNLKEMPHLLIAGATGSGKSVCINSIITSMLYKSDPNEVKFVLIDPKVVELGAFNGIPHLLIPVVTDSSKAAAALSWAVVEMTDRYKTFSSLGSKNLESYNNKVRAAGDPDSVMPQIVIIIDELADLMMVARNQVQEAITRIAQLGRAAGMHLIVATQRPSVDIITGVIKANIPARIAFAVSSGYDSKTILDSMGAEKLVGKGDMLYSPKGGEKPIRVQGTFISENEVNDVIEFVKDQVDEDYSQEVIERIESGTELESDESGDADPLLNDAISCVVDAGQASVSMLQRHFRIGYNRSARIVDQMEERGIVGPQDGSRPRKVLISDEEWARRNASAASLDD